MRNDDVLEKYLKEREVPEFVDRLIIECVLGEAGGWGLERDEKKDAFVRTLVMGNLQM